MTSKPKRLDSGTKTGRKRPKTGRSEVMKEAVKASMSASAPTRLKDLGLLQERPLDTSKGLKTIVVKADTKARRACRWPFHTYTIDIIHYKHEVIIKLYKV